MSDTTDKGVGPDRIAVTLCGKPLELHMSFGLLNELTGMVGNAALVGLIPTDAELGKRVLAAVLATRGKRGEILEEADLYSIPAGDAPELHRIFQWVMGHTLDFFLRSLGNAAAVAQRFGKEMEALYPPSQVGSGASPSATPSAGVLV